MDEHEAKDTDPWDEDYDEDKRSESKTQGEHCEGGSSGGGGESKEGSEELRRADVKVILLGDSAVGKSKLVERYLMDEYVPRQLSTYALTMYRKNATLEDGREVAVDFWDTAGQERFKSLHPSYYHLAKCCILVFDVTRKTTYQHLSEWFKEMRAQCEDIPCILVANKIDIDPRVTGKEFKFARRHGLPFFFVSAADGTNVVQVFQMAIEEAIKYKETPGKNFVDDVMAFLEEESPLDRLGDDLATKAKVSGCDEDGGGDGDPEAVAGRPGQ